MSGRGKNRGYLQDKGDAGVGRGRDMQGGAYALRYSDYDEDTSQQHSQRYHRSPPKSANQYSQRKLSEMGGFNRSRQQTSDDVRMSQNSQGGSTGGESEEEQYYCAGNPEKRCGKVLLDEDCIQCEFCTNWYHPMCQN